MKSMLSSGKTKNALLLLDKYPSTFKRTGKEHIGKQLIDVHARIFSKLAILPCTTKGIKHRIDKRHVLDKSPHSILVGELANRNIIAILYAIIQSFRVLFLTKRSKHELRMFISFFPYYFRIFCDINNYSLEHGRPQVVTCSVWGHDSIALAGFYYAKIAKIPFVLWEHRSKYGRHPNFNSLNRPEWSFLLRNSHKIFSVSHSLSEKIGNNFGIPISSFETIFNPISEEFTSSQGDNSSNVEGASQLVSDIEHFTKGNFVYSGWQNWSREMKRLDLFLDSIEILRNRGLPICALIIGKTPDWAQSQVKSRNLDETVFFTGMLDHEKIPEALQVVNCAVISSDSETFGNPAVEALSLGIPVVTTRCGGPEEIIIEDQLGYVVEPGNPLQLANAMDHVFCRRNSFCSLTIRSHALNTFSAEAFYDKWIKFYETNF